MSGEEIGDVLDGRYEIAGILGAGGMGRVYRGHDRRLGREVAIKVLRPELARHADVRARFEHEARAAAQISHPSAVIVFDSGEADDVPYMVMECLPGRTLADVLRAGPMPSARVRGLALDVLGALAAAHDLGIVHRDVKPGNILFTADGRAKLADFGIAKSTEGLDQTATGQLIGTPAYLAPERLEGKPASPASDLYSLGVVLYEALTAQKPFAGDTPVAVAHAIFSTTPPRPSETAQGVDAELDAVVVRALAKSPVERYSRAEDMAAALGEVGATHLMDAARAAPDPAPSSVRSSDEDATAFAPAGPPTLLDTDPPSRTTAANPATEHVRVGLRAPSRGPWNRDGRRRWAILLGGLALGLLVAVLLVNQARGPAKDELTTTSTTSPVTSGGGSLPEPLDRAIKELERDVQR